MSSHVSEASSERGGGAPLFSPPHSPIQELVQTTDHNDHQEELASDAAGAASAGALVPSGTLADVSAMCQEAQARIMTLQQAVGRQPGVTGQLNSLINNDLRIVAQLFISAQHMCNTVDIRSDHEVTDLKEELVQVKQQLAQVEQQLTDVEVQLQTAQRRLADAESLVIEAERTQQESDAGFASYVEGLKKELSSKEEIIEGLQLEIKELKELKDRKQKAPRLSFSSGTTAAGYNSAFVSDDEAPPVPRLNPDLKVPEMTEEKRKAMEKIWESKAGVRKEFLDRLRSIKDESREPSVPFDLEAIRRRAALKGKHTIRTETPPHGGLFPPPSRRPLIPTAREFRPTFTSPESQALFSPQYPAPFAGPSNALVPRREDDFMLDPEAKLWKDQFYQQFTTIMGWLQRHCGEVYPDVTARISRSQSGLWGFMCGLTYPTNPTAGHSHAVHMLNDPVLRPHFLLRAVLQYLEQNVWGLNMWLGFDRDQDRALLEANSRAEGHGYPQAERQFGVDTRKAIIQQFMKSTAFPRFQHFKGTDVVNRLKELTGPFLNPLVPKQEASLDLHVITTMAMELSTKMVTSRLTFNISWNECGVKFSDDMHISLNNQAPGVTLQFKHYRIMLVVTPSISYRDDTGRSIMARGVTKSQVLVMQ